MQYVTFHFGRASGAENKVKGEKECVTKYSYAAVTGHYR